MHWRPRPPTNPQISQHVPNFSKFSQQFPNKSHFFLIFQKHHNFSFFSKENQKHLTFSKNSPQNQEFTKQLSCDVPQPLFQKMPFENGWYYVGRATQERGHLMIYSQGFEEKSRQGLVCFPKAHARPPTGQEDHEGMLR